MSNAFNVEHLTFKYSSSKSNIIDHLSFQIGSGSFVCIVGPNGSGKTTLVKLLAGILQPTGGKIDRSSEFSALVFQNPDNQFVSNIVEEDVAFGPENLCLPPEKIRSVVDDCLKNVDMYGEKDRAISSLSGGEKQRVAIAGALALSSHILILDEPTSMLSFEGSQDIINYIKKINREKGVTVICVSQNPELALLADTLLIMKEGRLQAEVSPDDFVSRFDEFSDCGIVLPESVKLIKLLNENGFEIGIRNFSPKSIVKEIQKRC